MKVVKKKYDSGYDKMKRKSIDCVQDCVGLNGDYYRCDKWISA